MTTWWTRTADSYELGNHLIPRYSAWEAKLEIHACINKLSDVWVYAATVLVYTSKVTSYK